MRTAQGVYCSKRIKYYVYLNGGTYLNIIICLVRYFKYVWEKVYLNTYVFYTNILCRWFIQL